MASTDTTSLYLYLSRKKRNAEGDGFGDEAVVDRETASSVNLNTFVTYNDHHRALIVQGVRKRLVLTFPYDDHILRDTRYIIFQLTIIIFHMARFPLLFQADYIE